jgi:hypothetical protein
MPGFLGGSTGGSSGTGGEISFPKEFIDPVTKLRVSQPENLIDTDFEYGLQPTKWETVELINNTPSFFSKSGDTTIPNIVSITTNAGTREITVVTGLEHGVSVGIPIQVTGTKSITADGSYIINSIPNTTTFTYLCKANQATTASIEDLYSSILTGEFFQGAQLRVADASGIVTNNVEGSSTLTITTESAHGFKVNTPFYFLNLNSTISKDFQASNTAAKSFDSTNSAVAQTFDGSNTLSSINIDWSNSATVGGTVSTISGASTLNNTITVGHSASENFVGQPLGTPLYYAVTGGAGYFATNPRGVVFLKTGSNTTLASGSSTFQVSATPDGDVIPITAQPSGTFQLANQARTFAGNNVNPSTQIGFTITEGSDVAFEANNTGELHGNRLCTVASYSGSLVNVTTTTAAGLGYYSGAMVLYSTTGSAASGLTNNTTYFIDTFFPTGTDTYSFTIKPLPNGSAVTSISGGTGTQTFSRIGLSFDKDIVHVRNSNFSRGDLIEYSYPAAGQFNAASTRNYYFIGTAYDAHNYVLTDSTFAPFAATGGNTTTTITADGFSYRVHAFTTPGTSNLVVSDLGSGGGVVEYLLVAGGGGGGNHVSGGGGAGGMLTGTTTITSTGNKAVVVGAGAVATAGSNIRGLDGGNTTFNGLTAFGGGGGAAIVGNEAGRNGGSGGGAGGTNGSVTEAGGTGVAGQGNAGGNNGPRSSQSNTSGSGGGGAGARGHDRGFAYDIFSRNGGDGLPSYILGTNYWFAGGGGSGTYNDVRGGNGGYGGGGGGSASAFTPGTGDNRGLNTAGNGIQGYQQNGGNGAANTGGGGGGGSGGNFSPSTSAGGSGIAVIRYKINELTPSTLTATGGTITTPTLNGIRYRVHRFNTVGANSLTVSSIGSGANTLVDILVVAGGGGGGTIGNQGNRGAGGGAGGLIHIKNFPLAVGTYTATVGNGGGPSVNGQNSVFTGNGRTLTAIGGGKGGDSDGTANASAGGSGGGQWYPGYEGALSNQNKDVNDGITTWINCGYGHAGGHGYFRQPYSGGGGGAGGKGRGFDSLGGPQGGVGIQLDITGTLAYYAGGGGSAGFPPETGTYAEYAGGLGGGGTGSNDSISPISNGTANTGGGGGSTGSGGSGTIIIRYPIEVVA